MLLQAAPSFTPAAALIAFGTIGLIAALKRVLPHWPAMLIAIAAAALAVALLDLPVETIGTRFGGIPNTLPVPSLPELSQEKVLAVLPDAVAFALLGAIESLLSAVVADGMTGRRHRSNCELVAQGAANIASGLFGGICVTGTIARTATNVRSGAQGPVAGMLHALFLLLFILIAAPLAVYIPLASLAGVLVVVAWNMAERHAFAVLLKSSRGDALVLLSTFFLTVFRDLTEAIVVGVALGSIVFINRMAQATGVETHAPLVAEDKADDEDGGRVPYDAERTADRDVVVHRISGAFFFGAVSTVGAVLDRIAGTHRVFIIDFSAAPFIDATAANLIAGIARKAKDQGIKVFITGTSRHIRRELVAHGVQRPLATYKRTIKDALAAAKSVSARSRTP